ncbi:MAG: FRG domain-containing protein [Clostridia bacterium]|nr:FRG domain-containing protein [Clostridia bacterium]
MIIQNDFSVYHERLKGTGIQVASTDTEIKFTVDSFLKFDTLVSILHEIKNEVNFTSYFFYRGVNNEAYKLRSSLRVNYLENFEDELINEMYNKCPAEFSSCKSDFEMIAKMQHYGLPTRFIDFTKNPYVSLWFACQKNENIKNDTNGLIYLDDCAILMAHSMIKIITKIIMESPSESAENFFYNHFSYTERKDYLDLLLASDARFYFEPPKLDTREINQQSIFLAECNGIARLYKDENGNIIKTKKLSTSEIAQIRNNELKTPLEDSSKTLCFDEILDIENFNNSPMKKIIILKEAKKKILQELFYRGIKESFLFPTLNNTANEIKCDYKNQFLESGEEYE